MLVHKAGVALAALLTLNAIALVAQPSSQLVPGMQLVYASGGAESEPWRVEARRDTSLTGGVRCSIVNMKTSAKQPVERRFTCLSNDSLLVFEPGSTNLRLIRPVGPDMRAEIRGRVTVSTFETSAPRPDTVSGLVVHVVPTVVTTRDTLGRVLRRLRERYALALGTATGGVFEVPDSTQAGGWRVEREFELVRIVRPPGDR